MVKGSRPSLNTHGLRIIYKRVSIDCSLVGESLENESDGKVLFMNIKCISHRKIEIIQ